MVSIAVRKETEQTEAQVLLHFEDSVSGFTFDILKTTSGYQTLGFIEQEKICNSLHPSYAEAFTLFRKLVSELEVSFILEEFLGLLENTSKS